VAVDSALYQDLKVNLQKARAMVKPFNRHNDKLGFDYKLTHRAYQIDTSQQFAGSAYENFVKKAAAFHQESSPLYAEHLETMAKNFTINSSARDDLLATQPGAKVPLVDDDGYQRSIAGLNQELGEKTRELELARSKNEELAQYYEERLSSYVGKTVISPQELTEFPTEVRKSAKILMN